MYFYISWYRRKFNKQRFVERLVDFEQEGSFSRYKNLLTDNQ